MSAAPGPFPSIRAPQAAAGAIHSDLEKHITRAETIHWDTLLAAGSGLPRGPKARCVLKARTILFRMAT